MSKEIITYGNVLSLKGIEELLNSNNEEAILFSVDEGNSHTKVIASYMEKMVVMKMPTGYINVRERKTESLTGEVADDTYYIKGKESSQKIKWFEGMETRRSGFKDLEGGPSRYTSSIYALYMAVIFHKVAELFEIKNKNEVTFYSLSGVPSTYKGKNTEREKQNVIQNLPTIIAKGEEFTPKVEIVNTSQPLGTVYGDYHDSKGYRKENLDISNDTIMVIDLGGNTFDIEIIEYGEVLPDLRLTVENKGMNHILKNIAKHIFDKTDEAIHFQKLNKFFEKGIYQNESSEVFDFEEKKQEELDAMFNDYVAEIEKYKDVLKNISKVLITGGGSPYFFERFANLETNGKKVFPNIIQTENPQFANAIGFYKMALAKYEDKLVGKKKETTK